MAFGDEDNFGNIDGKQIYSGFHCEDFNINAIKEKEKNKELIKIDFSTTCICIKISLVYDLEK